MKFLKAITIMALLAGALSLGACAHKQESTTSTSAGTTTGYSK